MKRKKDWYGNVVVTYLSLVAGRASRIIFRGEAGYESGLLAIRLVIAGT